MEENRELAIEIISKFEELLSKKDIKIPNDERETKRDEACIYGKDYYELEDEITELLDNRQKEKK